ncbi:MAG TPA: glycosyltransferase family 39 protein [Nocardioides sp.]|nr:glycosyltransferase family 39 protein [Nocardioides sp.]
MIDTTAARSRVRGAFATVDPLLAGCCLVALVVYLVHGLEGPLLRDSGIYAYGGQRVAEGVPPYVGIANRAGPLAHLLPGGAVFVGRTVGADDLLAIRVFFMLMSVACVGLAYLLGRDLFRSRVAGVAAAAALLSFHGFISMATYGPREKTPLVLFTLATLLAIAHRRWLAAGFLVAMATLTWQPIFLALFAAAVVAVLLGLPRGEWWRAAVRVAVGGLVPAVVTVASYAVIGQLRVFLEGFVLINATYTARVAHSLLSSPEQSWRSLVSGFGASLTLVIVGSVAIVVAAALALRRKPREPNAAAVTACGVGCLFALAFTFRAFDSWPDAFMVLPFAAIGIGAAMGALAQRVPPRVAVATVAALSVACAATAVGYAVSSRTHWLDAQRRATATVLRVQPDATIFSVNAPQPLVLSGQRQGTRFHAFGNGMGAYLADTFPGGLRGYAGWIEQNRPTLIAVGKKRWGLRNPTAISDVPSWLAPGLRRSYQEVGDAIGWTWYARRDLGADKLRELGEAIRSPRSEGQT